VHAALLAALVRQGLTVQEAREACPWFFPSEAWMRAALAEVGFEVERLETEYRPTAVTERKGKEGGLEGWLRLMGAQMLEALEEEEMRDRAVREVCETLETVCRREEDGRQYLGYVRLRGVARRR